MIELRWLWRGKKKYLQCRYSEKDPWIDIPNVVELPEQEAEFEIALPFGEQEFRRE